MSASSRTVAYTLIVTFVSPCRAALAVEQLGDASASGARRVR